MGNCPSKGMTSNLDEDVRLVKHSFWRWPIGRFSNLIHQAAAFVDLVRHARPHCDLNIQQHRVGGRYSM